VNTGARAGGIRFRSRSLTAAAAALATLLVSPLATPGLAAQEIRSASEPGCGVFAVVQRSGMVIYPLPLTFLRGSGDTVWTASRGLAPNRDYLLDRTRGTLRLRGEPVPGETLWVRVCGLLNPPPLEYHFLRYRPARGDSASADSQDVAPPGRPATQRVPSEAPEGAALAISGNKTVAVEFGSSQDAFLRQSLDLAVTGTLAPGVELTGALSDRNTPLTAAGSTRDLQSLDRLLIELRAPRGAVALGDVALNLGAGEFARLDRQLQGVRGEWNVGGFDGVAAAASAEGEFQTLQFYGVEGRQGPYLLTGQGGATGLAVVPGSEVVTVDGERLTRGEGADYSIDYERAQITFSNRRPISSATRVTVDYQVTLNRFRRNFAAATARGRRGPWSATFAVLSETDDRGRPIAGHLDESDQLVLAAAGDSSTRALGSGVTTGGGDYDLVIGPGGSFYAFAGPDSGDYALAFARVGPGLGDYADSVVVGGRVAYRYVGAGAGAFRVGRLLPLPESHQLWSTGVGAHAGAWALDLEGALSRRDRNVFSARDDGDDWGGAGNARLTLEADQHGWLDGRAGMALQWRTVESRFEPFTRLERPFVQEEWGLPVGSDLEHQRRAELTSFARSRWGGELRAAAGRLSTADGFASNRGAAQWERIGTVVTHLRWERADGTQAGRRFEAGGRERRGGDLGLKLPWIEPAVRADWDERWTPSDTGRAGDRYREGGAELRSGARLPWTTVLGYGVRRSASQGPLGWRDLNEVRTARLSVQTPEERAWSTALAWQRRSVRPLGDPTRGTSDLASARVRGTAPARGLSAQAGLEITSEGENERLRQVVRVGSGQGAYDSLGTFVGTGRGDYTLVITIGPALRRITRAATSLRLTWQPPAEGVWQGSRGEISVETDARRLGDLVAGDALLSPATARSDQQLSRAAVTQRVEGELAPQSPFGSLGLRIERRVSADRSFTLFAQVQDDRSGTLRWRTRPAAGWTTEVEGRLRRNSFAQSSGGAPGFARSAREGGVQGQTGYTPSARMRAALVSDLSWTRDEGAAAVWSKTWRAGPELGVSLFGPGRLELSARRTLIAGSSLSTLLPLGDPLGAPRWESTARFDYRLRDQTTLGISLTSRDRDHHAPEHEGRAELRAFF
jgi:hypothetical protein